MGGEVKWGGCHDIMNVVTYRPISKVLSIENPFEREPHINRPTPICTDDSPKSGEVVITS